MTAKPDNMTRRGCSSFANERQITASKTIGEAYKFNSFERRCPSGLAARHRLASFYPYINPLVTFRRTLHENVLFLASLSNKYP